MSTIKARFKLTGPEISQDTYIVDTNGLRVGRLDDNDLTLRHREISRQHLRVIWRQDTYFVEDLNSANGTFLNDDRLDPRDEVELNIGDVIRFGPFLLRLESWIEPENDPIKLPPIAGPYYNGHLEARKNGRHVEYLPGIPHDKSNWLQYLPAIYEDDEFLGRYLLIFESLLSPITWTIDNFDLFLSPDMAPRAWLQWMAGWFDILLLPELPMDRQREIMRQIGWLFMRRGTPSGLQRLLELYFGVIPEIIEDEPCHFVVRLPLSQSNIKLSSQAAEDDGGHTVDRRTEIADRLIESQKPAFASYTLEVF